MKSIITIICLLVLQVSFARTIVVGKAEVVSSLRKAVDIANEGDTILLQKGIYKEGAITITKSLRLIGVGIGWRKQE